MADPTPPADVPSPTSPNPEPAGPKRIRSMPTRERVSMVSNESLTGTSSEKEMNWKRGAVVLWLFFFVIAALELANEAGTLLGGHPWPPPFDAIRAAAFFALFVGLWVGWGWLRYLLAVVEIPAALWLAINVIAANQTAPKPQNAQMVLAPPPFSFIESIPKALLALVYVVMGFYLIISADVLGFVRQRRRRGGTLAALLTALIAYAFLFATLSGQPYFTHWLASQQPAALDFARQLVNTSTENWDPAVIENVGDGDFVKTWINEGHKSTFVQNKVLGPLQSIDPPLDQVSTDLRGFGTFQPGAMTGSPILSGTSRDGHKFLLAYRYQTPVATFAHGHGPLSVDLTRELSGPWRVTTIDTARLIPDPTPTPPPTPAPEASPGASPAAEGSPGAAPAPAIPSPAPVSSPAPPLATPAASAPAVTPAATPAPSTGG